MTTDTVTINTPEIAVTVSPVEVFVTPEVVTVVNVEVGQQGLTGAAGKSAYEIAVSNGFVGTEQQWLDSLSASAAADISTLIIAAVDLGGNRAVLSNGNYADNLDIAGIGNLAGITKTSAVAGEAVSVVFVGNLNGFFGLTPNQAVFLSTNGTLTQTAPTSGYIQKLGIATSTDTILINIDPPIEVI